MVGKCSVKGCMRYLVQKSDTMRSYCLVHNVEDLQDEENWQDDDDDDDEDEDEDAAIDEAKGLEG